MQFIADNAAAISARLKELESEKAKARGDDLTDDKTAASCEQRFPNVTNYQGTPPTWAYQAPDDFMG